MRVLRLSGRQENIWCVMISLHLCRHAICFDLDFDFKTLRLAWPDLGQITLHGQFSISWFLLFATNYINNRYLWQMKISNWLTTLLCSHCDPLSLQNRLMSRLLQLNITTIYGDDEDERKHCQYLLMFNIAITDSNIWSAYSSKVDLPSLRL